MVRDSNEVAERFVADPADVRGLLRGLSARDMGSGRRLRQPMLNEHEVDALLAALDAAGCEVRPKADAAPGTVGDEETT